MKLFHKSSDIKSLSEEELRKQYKKLSDIYDKKPTQQTAILMNEIVDEWKRREKEQNKATIIEDPPIEIQKEMQMIGQPEPKPAEPEKPVEIIPMEFIQEISRISKEVDKVIVDNPNPIETKKPKFNWFNKPKQPNGHTKSEWGNKEPHTKEELVQENNRIDQELERIQQQVEQKEKEKQEKKFKKSLSKEKSKVKLGGFFSKKEPKEYCIKCKHEAKHHTRKDGTDEGCKICGCLKTLAEIQSQEEKADCELCKKPVYIIEATTLNEKPYHHKCYEEQLWNLTKEDD